MLFLGLLLLAGSGAFTALAIVGILSGGPAYTVPFSTTTSPR